MVESGREAGTRAAPRAPGRARRRGRRSPTPAARGVLLPFAERAGERDEVRGEVARVHRGDVARIERPQVARVVPVVQVPAVASACAPWCRASPRCGRARRAGRTSRSRAPPRSTADRGRCWWARCGAPPPPRGSSWKLSGGRWLSSAVTKVSKKRQVRRAISRSSRCCVGRQIGFRHRRRRAADAPREQRRGEPQQQERQRDGGSVPPVAIAASTAGDHSVSTDAAAPCAGRSCARSERALRQHVGRRSTRAGAGGSRTCATTRGRWRRT